VHHLALRQASGLKHWAYLDDFRGATVQNTIAVIIISTWASSPIQIIFLILVENFNYGKLMILPAICHWHTLVIGPPRSPVNDFET
jgi:hypothetical protein